jgi:hypothetical protein
MFAVPQSIQYEDNITTYQFSLIFADILNWDLTNEKDCVSDMSLEARRFLSYIKRGINTFPELYDNMDVVLPANAIPFFERFGDHVAGVAMDVQLQVFEDLNACDYYVSATPTPTNTATPTMTPTETLTPTPTIGQCVEILLIAGGSGSNFYWTDCDGNPATTFIPNDGTTTVCGIENTVTYDGGGSVLYLGPCPSPSPTPTLTPTPTNTATPTTT